jgi:paired amphipathic helix protein Sin3a
MRHRRKVRGHRYLHRLVGCTGKRCVSPRRSNFVIGAPFYPSNAATSHNQNLPSLPGLTAQPQLSSPRQSTQRPSSSSEAGPGTQSHQGPQGPQYSLPGISQTLHQQQHMATSEQANVDRERELREREGREREMMESHVLQQHATQQEDLVKREAEQRDRELHERQQREQTAHQNHSGPIQIHQPVAVAPSARTIHGPNGLLGQAGPLNGPNTLSSSMNGPNVAGPIYGSAPVQHDQTTPRMQHAVQPPPQAQMLMPFAGPPGAMGMGQGQQPILNASLGIPSQGIAS